MRTKEQIVNDLKRTKQNEFSTYHNGTPPECITIEVLIDIRDILEDFRQTQKYFLQRISKTDKGAS